jgi:hypothetical protein
VGEPAIQRTLFDRPDSSGARHTARNAASLSPALAPTLTIAAGTLTALGALGTWVRTSIAAVGGADPTSAETVVGRAEGGGPVVLVLGVLAVVAGAGWVASRVELRRVAAFATVLLLAVTAGTVVAIDRRAREVVEAAGSDPAFSAFHAGFGWGAWLVLLGAVAAALALLAGGLAALDRKRER